MCGIFGYSGPSADSKLARASLNTLKHRGPDQWAEWQNDHVYLGHRRLSIVDLSDHGRQPMTDGQIYITVNGEIYNYPELKKELQHKYQFQSHSDSEILIHGYKEWGIEKLLKKIEGMYAFALYDSLGNKLYLARDRVGIKPLYYSQINGRIAWASELKALTHFHKSDELEIDKTAVYDFLTYIYIPSPKSVYKQIRKLEPANYLKIDVVTGRLSQHRYWQLDTRQKAIDLETAADKTRQLINQAVKDQLMSDVPLGFFLSGGMDSSAVVAAATRAAAKVHTYSIGFDIKEHSETHFARLVAKRFGTKHLTRDLAVEQVSRDFSNLKKWFDEPFADTSAFPTYLVSKLARATSTVVLSGDGGDEVFGGYNWYTKFKDAQPGKLASFLKRAGQADKDLKLYASLMGGLTKEAKQPYRQLLNIDKNYDDYWYFRKYYRTDLPLLTRLQYMDFHTYLPDDILTKVDRASMAVSLECRVPLLATPLIEFSFSLPEEIRYTGGQLKGLMKHALAAEIPAEIIQRDKKGFSIPTGKWGKRLKETDEPMPVYILEQLFSDLLKV